MKEGQGFARRVTLENLEKFSSLLQNMLESGGTKNKTKKRIKKLIAEISASQGIKEIETIFKGKSIKISIPFKASFRKNNKIKKVTQSKRRTPIAAVQGTPLWEKMLSATDAQVQTGHATGDLRLVQAKWKVAGRTINQTTYFRDDVFGNFKWGVVKQHPLNELTKVFFKIIIQGRLMGTYKLAVRHKPSGEASQGNYTTSILWGAKLSRLIRSMNLTGKTLRLFDPSGNKKRFIIEIS